MKILRITALLLLCLCLLPGCRKELPDGVVMPETHAEAVNPASVKSIRFVHYDAVGEVDLDLTLDSDSPFVPLVATVYDKASETTSAGESAKLFELTFTMKRNKEMTLVLYTDMTMFNGETFLTGQDMFNFLHSFLPVPNAEVEQGVEPVV